jgi:tRNA 2-thiouridine synthesizing protein A
VTTTPTTPATLDLRGEVCPYTFVRARLAVEELPLGAALTVVVDHAPAAASVPRALAACGHEIVAVEHAADTWHIHVVKRAHHRLEKEP